MEIAKLKAKNFKEVVDKSCRMLKQGGLVVFPTETCYGIAALATDQKAVNKLLKYKRRPEGKAISIAVSDISMAEKYVVINDTARKLYRKFLPGPLTVVSKDRKKLAHGLASEQGTLGIRMPDYKFALEIVKMLGLPITSTSANVTNKKTPHKIQDIFDHAGQKQLKLIDLVIDAGELPHNPPSTVIDTTRQEMQVLRQGDINFGKNKASGTINSPEEMSEAGERLIQKYKNFLKDRCLLVLFNAELGAGKTQFVKGMASELGIKEIVNSPTYALVKEYKFTYNANPGVLAHFDAWRLENIREFRELDIENYLKPGNVVAVEWAGATVEYLVNLAKKKRSILVEVRIDYLSEIKRRLTIND